MYDKIMEAAMNPDRYTLIKYSGSGVKILLNYTHHDTLEEAYDSLDGVPFYDMTLEGKTLSVRVD